MADGGTIRLRITDLIGSQHTDDAAYDGDLINAAINEIADMLPTKLLMKYSKTPGVLESNSEWLVEGRKILKVTRIDSDSSGIERECKEVDRAGFALAEDTGSIYKATAYSPIYHQDTANDGAATLKILPVPTTPQKGKIWYFSYVADSADSINITGALLNTSLCLPSELIHAIALKSSLNILKAYISNQIQDEEDIELLGMLQKQCELLEKDFITEMQRYVPDMEKPKGE
jgi:hypothetical protein